MDSYQAMQGWLDKANAESLKQFGRSINPEEEKKFKKEFNALATEHGLWEAGPEAIGNVLDIALLTARNVVPGARFIPKGVAGKLVKGAARIGGVLATEEITETVTGMGQQRVEAEVGGGEKRQWDNPEDWLETAREVLPQVIMLTGVMGAGGAVYRKATQKEGEEPGKLKQYILDSVIEAYDAGEQTPERTIESIMEGYQGGLIGDSDIDALSSKHPELKEGFVDAKKVAKTAQVKNVLLDAINTGLKSGELEGEEFTPDHAIDFIRKGLDGDIFTSEDIEGLKEEYPDLRHELNGLIAETVTTRVDLEFDEFEFEPTTKPEAPEVDEYAIEDIEETFVKAKERVRKEPLTLNELQERFRDALIPGIHGGGE